MGGEVGVGDLGQPNPRSRYSRIMAISRVGTKSLRHFGRAWIGHWERAPLQ